MIWFIVAVRAFTPERRVLCSDRIASTDWFLAPLILPASRTGGHRRIVKVVSPPGVGVGGMERRQLGSNDPSDSDEVRPQRNGSEPTPIHGASNESKMTMDIRKFLLTLPALMLIPLAGGCSGTDPTPVSERQGDSWAENQFQDANTPPAPVPARTKSGAVPARVGEAVQVSPDDGPWTYEFVVTDIVYVDPKDCDQRFYDYTSLPAGTSLVRIFVTVNTYPDFVMPEYESSLLYDGDWYVIGASGLVDNSPWESDPATWCVTGETSSVDTAFPSSTYEVNTVLAVTESSGVIGLETVPGTRYEWDYNVPA